MAKQFPVVSITGPRQSGKTTLVKAIFPSYSYVSLEEPDMRAFASDDPRAFLAHYGRHTIIDEAQRVPSLFSYLQGMVDATGEPGQFIISGSQNFLLMEAIDQSLAGRVAVLNLLPLSLAELGASQLAPQHTSEWVFTGGYPRIYDYGIHPCDYYPNYLQTYLERDVRTSTGIVKLAEFERLLALCATRTSEMLNVVSLSRDCDVAINTINEWLSVLEASFLVSRLQPYYRNLGKRITKTPKLYLCDQGLASNLLGLQMPTDIDLSPHKGALFETTVLAEVSKTYAARGQKPRLYYWRDAAKREIDLLVEQGTQLAWAIEVKSSTTYDPKFFRHLNTVAEELAVDKSRRVVVYAGQESFHTSHGIVCALRDLFGLLTNSASFASARGT
ncbi:MAG: ATP-binding protein [Coriobacteriales bacterium]|nr:ATP-binding protein [Coriobacteriales bacterium]